jgi:hypothetical protein
MGKACRLIKPGKPEAPTLGNNLMPGYIITIIFDRLTTFGFINLSSFNLITISGAGITVTANPGAVINSNR